MRAQIRERRILQGVQSASGLERIDDFYFVVGDDSPNLFRLDLQFQLAGTTRLFATETRDGERIAKLSKPDLEAMCGVEWQGRREILCFGSGSKSPARDVCYRVDVTDAAFPQNVRIASLMSLHDTLRANPDIVGTHTLNLEAASATENTIALFQRGNISTINAVMEYDLRAFMEYLDGTASAPPSCRVTTYTLPKTQNRCAGFSAAMTFGPGVLFSATVEDTDNEIDDGDTLGSFIGYLENDILQWVSPVEYKGVAAPVKIEGITLMQATASAIEIAAVTDNDEGASELLVIGLA